MSPGRQDELLASYLDLDAGYPQSRHFLTEAERRQLFAEAANHPVAGLARLGEYDPQGFIGFCFGRATAVALLARRTGLEPAGIAKLFIIGDLRSRDDPELRFHVTTLVKSEDGTWFAIDPMLTATRAEGEPVPAEEWIRLAKARWDPEDKAILYMTETWPIVPDIAADDEGMTGKHIIELAFDPSAHHGFTPTKVGKYTVNWVERPAGLQHFLGIVSAQESAGFDLTGMLVPSLARIGIDPNVSYNNYFVDLLDSFTTPRPIEVR